MSGFSGARVAAAIALAAKALAGGPAIDAVFDAPLAKEIDRVR